MKKAAARCKMWNIGEDEQILQLQAIHGNKWTLFSKIILGRSACAIKARWTILNSNSLQKDTNNTDTKNSECRGDEVQLDCGNEY